MQLQNSTPSTTVTAQALADAALAYLSLHNDQTTQPSVFTATEPAPFTSKGSERSSSRSSLEQTRKDVDVTTGQRAQIKSEFGTSPTTLPSLLQYVDHILMEGVSLHDQPPTARQTCKICNLGWNKASTSSTFLPLSPCNHWVHYRCLIWLATREGPHRDKCYACDTRLYQWDGISALTLATRTGLLMGESQTLSTIASTHVTAISDNDAYEQECQLINKVIADRFFNQLTQPSKFSDNSPDLVQCYDGVLNDLRLMKRPHSKWLKWSTHTGSLLFGMLVAIKIRRFLVEGHSRITWTEAWTAWEDGCRVLQRRILEEVHR